MSWSAADSAALFRHGTNGPANEDDAVIFDGGQEAMRRLRFPFEAEPADGLEQEREIAQADDEDRR